MFLPLLLLPLLREFLPDFLALLAGVVLPLDLVHDPEDGEEPGSGNIADILVEFEHKAAIGDDLPALLE